MAISAATRSAPSPRPPFLSRDIDSSKSVGRAAWALARNRLLPEDDAADLVRRNWPADRGALNLISRTATAPASMTQTGWAAELSGTDTGPSYVASLSGATGALAARAMNLSLAGIASLNLPTGSSLGTSSSWISEGGAIGVGQGSINKAVLGPIKKVGIIEVTSRELLEGSAGQA